MIKLDSNYDIVAKTLKSSIHEWVTYQIGIRLKNSIPKNAPLYHVREDEFLIMVASRAESGEISAVSNKIFHICDATACFFRTSHFYELWCIQMSLFPVAEETSLIFVIGKWRRYTATVQIKEWKDNSRIQSGLAINVSPKQINNNELIDSIERIIQSRVIEPSQL